MIITDINKKERQALFFVRFDNFSNYTFILNTTQKIITFGVSLVRPQTRHPCLSKHCTHQ